MMRGDALEDVGERTDLDRIVIWNNLAIHPVLLGRHADV